MISWAGFGVCIVKEVEHDGRIEIYITVPEHSYRRNVDGEEIAGRVLAKRFKTALTEMGVTGLTVKFQIRPENWTKEMGEKAEKDMMQAMWA